MQTKPAPPHIYISLRGDALDALSTAATREERPLKYQAVRYVLAGLRRDGYLPPEPSEASKR